MIKKLFSQFLTLISQILGYIPSLIYGYIYSEYFTKYFFVYS